MRQPPLTLCGMALVALLATTTTLTAQSDEELPAEPVKDPDATPPGGGGGGTQPCMLFGWEGGSGAQRFLYWTGVRARGAARVLHGGKPILDPRGFSSRLWTMGQDVYFIGRHPGATVDWLWKFRRQLGNPPDVLAPVVDADGNEVAVGEDLAVLSGHVWFCGRDAFGGELWRVPVGQTTAERVADVSPVDSRPGAFTVAGDKLFFAANDVNGGNLYVYDPTAAGSTPVALTTNDTPDRPIELVATAATGAGPDVGLFFVHRGRVWFTTGQAGGSKEVTSAGGAFASPGNLVYLTHPVNGSSRLFFVDAGPGTFPNKVGDLFAAPPTAEGATLPAALIGDAFSTSLVSEGGRLYFVGTGNTPWFWSQPGQTPPAQPFVRGGPPDQVASLVGAHGRVYAVARAKTGTAPFAHELLRLDPRGLTVVGAFESAIEGFFTVQDELFFIDTSEGGRDLWTRRKDALEPTRRVATDPPDKPAEGSFPRDYVVIAGKGLCVFSATGAAGRELHVTDGTADGTRLLGDIHGNPSNLPSDPEQLVAVGDHVFFVATDEANGRELRVTNGVPAGGTNGNAWPKVFDIAKDRLSSNVRHLTRLGDRVYFSAQKAGQRAKLMTVHATDATTFTSVIEVEHRGSKLLEPEDLTVIDGYLFFTAIRGGTPDRGRTVFVAKDSLDNGHKVTKVISVGIHCRVEGPAGFTRFQSAAGDHVLFRASRAGRQPLTYRVDFARVAVLLP